MKSMPFAKLEKGTLMVATPDIDSGLFYRSVVLICEHNTQGSFGLVLNKALDVQLPDEILNLDAVENQHVSLRAGGPVQTNQMMLLHTSDGLPNQTLQVVEGVFLGGDLEFLQQVIRDEEGPSVNLCFGYAGWNAGQLEREFLDGHWFVHPARKEHVFGIPTGKLWSSVLREMGGKYAALSMIPEDLTLN